MRVLALSSVFVALCSAAPSWPSDSGSSNDYDSWHKGTAAWPSLLPSSVSKSSGNPVVALASGLVVGTTTSVALTSSTGAVKVVNKFLGIPFAQSPPIRFSPPQNAARWNEPLDATQFRNSCLQQFNYPIAVRSATILFSQGDLVVPEDEDCLYLNVWVPTGPPKDGKLRTVMFWIYGGTLQTGFAGLPQYDGASFAANQDVVLVSTNYRTGIFGFSNSPEIAYGQQNSGFLDQRKALEWVQQNIERLGGDPKKVTVFGESAGALSVKQLIANPPSPLTFRAAILQSQATTRSNGTASWNTVVAACNCTGAASPLACVRALPASTVDSIVEHGAFIFPPVVDNVTNSGDVSAQIATKTWAKVPILIGNNANEGRIFALGLTNLTAYLSVAAAFVNQSAVRAALIAYYGLTSASTATQNYQAISDVLTNLRFLCPVVKISDDATKAGYDVWRYYFNASYPGAPVTGAYHGAEITTVFGTYNHTTAGAQEIALSTYMQTTWADFAKNPAGGPGWPKMGTDLKDLGDIGGSGSFGEYNIDPATVDGVCAVYAPLLAATGV